MLFEQLPSTIAVYFNIKPSATNGEKNKILSRSRPKKPFLKKKIFNRYSRYNTLQYAVDIEISKFFTRAPNFSKNGRMARFVGALDRPLLHCALFVFVIRFYEIGLHVLQSKLCNLLCNLKVESHELPPPPSSLLHHSPSLSPDLY